MIAAPTTRASVFRDRLGTPRAVSACSTVANQTRPTARAAPRSGPGPRTASASSSNSTPLLLVHGALVNGHLWDLVTPTLAETHRVIRPHLPLGAHGLAAERRDLVHPEGVADALAALLEALSIDQAVVMGSDTGGAIAQILTARHPEKVRALVLTSCDAFNHFLPTALKPVTYLLAIPGFIDLVGFAYRSTRVRRSPLGPGLVLNKPIDDALMAPFFDQVATDREARRDLAAFLRRCGPALTNAAAESLRSFPRPVLLAWSRKDPLFPERDAERLNEMIPDCQLQWITGAKAFSMIDQPDQLLSVVRPFLAQLTSIRSDISAQR